MRIVVIIQHATSTNLLLWWCWLWRRNKLCRVCWLSEYLANKFIAITAYSSNKYYCLYVSLFLLPALKAKNGNFIAHLWFFSFHFCLYELRYVLMLLALNSIPTLTYCWLVRDSHNYEKFYWMNFRLGRMIF